MEGVAMVPNFLHLFHCWHHNPAKTLSLCLLDHAYHVAFMLAKKSLSLGMTVVLLVYIYKLVCSNSDRDKELIRE